MGPPLRANRNISERAGEDTRPYKTFRDICRGRALTGPRAAKGRTYRENLPTFIKS